MFFLIYKRISINHVKRRQIELVPFVGIEPSQPVANSAMTDTQISWKSIQRAMNKLPSEYRQVLKLYLLEGFDHQEISDILSISEATSKSRFCRAKRKLRTILQHQFPQYEAA